LRAYLLLIEEIYNKQIQKYKEKHDKASMEIEDLAHKLQKTDKVLGLDPGKKTIGIALASVMLGVATPIETIKRVKFSKDIIRLAQIVKEHEVKALIIGLPLNMDGSEGRRAQSVQDLGLNIKQHMPSIEIAYWDERLSSHHMDSFLIEEVDLSRKKRANVIDKLAAQHILQGAIDRIRDIKGIY
jgi:putative Holliday junction resolvase